MESSQIEENMLKTKMDSLSEIEEFSQDSTEDLFPDVWFTEDYSVQVYTEPLDSLLDCAQQPLWAMEVDLNCYETLIDSLVDIHSASRLWENSCTEEDLMDLITQATWVDNDKSLMNIDFVSQPSGNVSINTSVVNDQEIYTAQSLDGINRDVTCWNIDFYDEKRAIEVDFLVLEAMKEYEKTM